MQTPRATRLAPSTAATLARLRSTQEDSDANPCRLRDHLRVPAADADAADAQRPSVAPARSRDAGAHRLRPADAGDATTVDGFGNVCTRIVAPAGPAHDLDRVRRSTTAASPTSSRRRPSSTRSRTCPTTSLVFLLGSRYCDTDRLERHRLVAVRQHAARLGAGAGDLRLRPRPHHLRLPARRARPRTAWDGYQRAARASAATSPTWRSPSAAA